MQCSTEDPGPATAEEPPDPMLQKIVDALEQIRSEEFDYEILKAASEVTGEDELEKWRPSLSYLPPEQNSDEYNVTIFAKGACESCPVGRRRGGAGGPGGRARGGAGGGGGRDD